MLAMSIIVMVVGAWFVSMGIIGIVVHSRRIAELSEIAKEEGLTWDRAGLESAIKQLRGGTGWA